MRQARKALIGVTASAVLLAMALPAGAAIGSAGGSDSPVADMAKKKKCKKGKKKCKKGKRGGFYLEGRYGGSYGQNNVDLFFNVAGGRVYTGAFDSFFIDAPCNFGLSDQSSIKPVQAFIAPNGTFSGSGVWVVAGGTGPSGFQIPWTLSGQISGTTITSGVFSVGPYSYSDGKTCSGSTTFAAQWFAPYTL